MREIEVKVKIESFEPVIKKLEELGCKISDPIIQKDIIFDKKETGIGIRNILRIRELNGIYLFTLKRDASDELDCVEREVEINDLASMKEIIELLGYTEIVRVNKKRRKCKYGDYEICLDDVDNLGFFIEAEKLSDEDVNSIRKELINFLELLGVDISKRVFQGYDTILEERIK